jgi:hypothetical protein
LLVLLALNPEFLTPISRKAISTQMIRTIHDRFVLIITLTSIDLMLRVY